MKEFLTLEELISLFSSSVIVETDLSGEHGELIGIDKENGTIKVKTDDGYIYYAQISDGVTLYEENED